MLKNPDSHSMSPNIETTRTPQDLPENIMRMQNEMMQQQFHEMAEMMRSFSPFGFGGFPFSQNGDEFDQFFERFGFHQEFNQEEKDQTHEKFQ